MRNKVSVSILISIWLLVNSIAFVGRIGMTEQSLSLEKQGSAMAYTGHAPFNITSNAGFAASGWNGSGIDMYSSMSNVVFNNLITNNTHYGITLVGESRFNQIYGNAIGWNELGNAYDDGSNNTWFDEGNRMGNWWSDFNSTSSDVYEIDGDANSIDYYPIAYSDWTLELPIKTTTIGIEIILVSVAGVGAVVIVIVFFLRRKQIL